MSKIQSVFERIQVFIAAWRSLAPAESFAGMTLEQFEAAVAPSIERRQELKELEQQVEAKRTDRQRADDTSRGILELVVNSVRGTPGFGSDSTLYRSLGYVRKSERRSGLTRKGQESTGGANAA